MKRRLLPARRGFTLVELMVVVAIVGILATIGASMGSKAMMNLRQSQFLRRWQSAIQVARQEAMRRGLPTAIATLPVEQRNGGNGGGPPSGRGMMVYVDVNRNGRYDGSYSGVGDGWAGASGEPIVWAYPQSPTPDLCALYGAKNADFSSYFGPEHYTLYPTQGGAALLNFWDPLYFTPLGQTAQSWRKNAFYSATAPMNLWAPSFLEFNVQLSSTCTTDRSNIYATIEISRIGAVRAKVRR